MFVSQHADPLINVNICIHRSTSVLLPARKWWKIERVNLFLSFPFFLRKSLFVFTFFLSLIEPRPNTDILHIVSSCSRFKELPFGPNSFPTKLNCKSQFKNNNNLVLFLFFFFFHCVLKRKPFERVFLFAYLRMVTNRHGNTYRNLYRFVTRYVYHFAFFVGHVRHWRWRT